MYFMDENINMGFADFSIPSNYHISMYNTDFSFFISLNFFPGSSLYVDEKSSIHFMNKKLSDERNYLTFARVCFVDQMVNDFYLTTNDGGTSLQHFFLPTTFYENLGTSHYVIDGTLIFNTNFDPFTFEETTKITEQVFVLKEDESDIDLKPFYFYSLGGYVDLSQDVINAIKENSNFLRTNSYFLTPSIFYASQHGSYGAAHFYNLPLITNHGVIFQSESSHIIIGESYDNGLIKVNNEYYFYDFQLKNFLTEEYSGMGDALSNNPPKTLATARKYTNLSGTFKKCIYHEKTDSSYPFITSYAETEEFLKVFVFGAYIDVEYSNDEGKISYDLDSNDLLICDQTKYKFGDHSINDATPNYKLIDTLMYEEDKERFIFRRV